MGDIKGKLDNIPTINIYTGTAENPKAIKTDTKNINDI